FIWAMWFAEWPLRIVGALIGVWLAKRLRRWADETPDGEPAVTVRATTDAPARPVRRRPGPPRARGRGAAAVRLLASILACVVPMTTSSSAVLGSLALISVIYALWVGLRWRVLHAL